MTPRTTAQNLLLWGAALAVSVLLSFLSGLATHWPESGIIDWRGVWLDVIQTVLTTAPIVAAGLGLPRLGKEQVATLVSQVGAGPAKAALEVEAIRQAAGTIDPATPEGRAALDAEYREEREAERTANDEGRA